MKGRLIPLRPRFLYLGVWVGRVPVGLVCPLFLLEGLLLAVLWWEKTRALRGQRPRLFLPLGAVFAFRALPPLVFLEVEAEGVKLKVGLW
ncbi:hypothetical protein QT17_01195 [Thermus sp. 2.9]|uniref:hypothetical protein n=1 Tax=unclassified Thermus TaxID=2619321 RepID=UPI0005421759|nr:hypothetical protein [Thermus sp. 2.9]KHG66577.1 hypothetical protein QT17_01195 [Thermus sp. 2.9]